VGRRKLIAANWKMNKTLSEAESFASELVRSIDEADCDLLVIPSFFAVPVVARAVAGSPCAVGAQNLHWEPSGAFTGEVSAAMVKDAGATYALVGHSERRHVMGEDDTMVARKLRAAVDAGLTPILCVGETLDERESARAERVVAGQLEAALAGWTPADAARIVVAYEPVWAIGTGRTATPDDAAAMHGFIRSRLRRAFGEAAAALVRIQYGGSVKPDNAAELLGRDDIDGALVGGASLQVESFLGIAAAAGPADGTGRRPVPGA
jgi:triosephosphate isomerase